LDLGRVEQETEGASMTAPKSLACVFDAHGVCRLAGCSCLCHQNEFIPILNIGC